MSDDMLLHAAAFFGGNIDALKAENAALKARIEELTAALRFYAEKDNWAPSQNLKGVISGKYYTPVESDGGYKASAALGEKNDAT